MHYLWYGDGYMRLKWLEITYISTILLLVVSMNVYGWCESGFDPGDYQTALTSDRLCDSHCVKSEIIGKKYTFVPFGVSQSSICPKFPVVYCGDIFMGELHSAEASIACKEGESIRVAYTNDNVCKELANHVEGIISVTEEPVTITTSVTEDSVPTTTATTSVPASSNWIYWVVGGSAGVIITAILTTGGVYLFKKYAHRAGQPDGTDTPLLPSA